MKRLIIAISLIAVFSFPFAGKAQIKRLPTVTDVDCNYFCEVNSIDDMAWTWWFGPQVWSSNDYKSKL